MSQGSPLQPSYNIYCSREPETLAAASTDIRLLPKMADRVFLKGIPVGLTRREWQWISRRIFQKPLILQLLTCISFKSKLDVTVSQGNESCNGRQGLLRKAEPFFGRVAKRVVPVQTGQTLQANGSKEPAGLKPDHASGNCVAPRLLKNP